MLSNIYRCQKYSLFIFKCVIAFTIITINDKILTATETITNVSYDINDVNIFAEIACVSQNEIEKIQEKLFKKGKEFAKLMAIEYRAIFGDELLKVSNNNSNTSESTIDFEQILFEIFLDNWMNPTSYSSSSQSNSSVIQYHLNSEMRLLIAILEGASATKNKDVQTSKKTKDLLEFEMDAKLNAILWSMKNSERAENRKRNRMNGKHIDPDFKFNAAIAKKAIENTKYKKKKRKKGGRNKRKLYAEITFSELVRMQHDLDYQMKINGVWWTFALQTERKSTECIRQNP